MKGIIGKKLGMTRIFIENGDSVPVTVVEVGPCPVLRVRTKERDGYSAVQLGYGQRKAKGVGKPVKGQLTAAGLQDTPPALIQEIRLTADPEQNVGDRVTAEAFAADEYVDVTGITKGRGFQGVVKRYGFGGGRASHGGGWTRRPGSIGMKEEPGKVYKGRKMPGHMGHDRRTIQSLQIVAVKPEDHLLLIRGAVPGPSGGHVMVRSAIKKQRIKQKQKPAEKKKK